MVTGSGTRTLFLFNIIVSLAIVVFGLLLWNYPQSSSFPPWFWLIISAYGAIRAYVFYVRWRTAKTETDR